MKNRGLYGQDEGNGRRGGAQVVEDIICENNIAEGEWEAQMRKAGRAGNLRKVARLRDAMKAEAVASGCDDHKAQERADLTMTRALAGLRF